MTQTHQQLVAFVGLSGSGKTAAALHLREKNIPVVYFGDVIRKAMEQAGIEPTWENQQEFRESIRAREGKEFVARQAIAQIRNLFDAGQHKIVLDGLYTWPEYRAVKHAFPGTLTVIAIVSPRNVRYRRLEKRPVRPMSPQEASDRDFAEIEHLEKGGPIAMADYFLHNDKDIDYLHEQIDQILEEIHFLPA